MRDLKRHYQAGGNVMGYLRQRDGGTGNSAEAILAAYDLQAGSYVAAMTDPAHRASIVAYAGQIAQLIDRLGGSTILEAGVGEATTLCSVVNQLSRPPALAAGFDISWSRIMHAQRYAAANRTKLDLVIGDLFAAPAVDKAFDIVFTAHVLEPNRGRERAAIEALYRLARRYLILLEPAATFGNEKTKARIELHQYCTGLADHAAALGLNVVEHRLFDVAARPDNQSELIVIACPDAPAAANSESTAWLGCPTCHTMLASHEGHYYCSDCCVIYPVVGGIACLQPETGILASAFLPSTSATDARGSRS